MLVKTFIETKIVFFLYVFFSLSLSTFSQTPKGIILDEKDEVAQGKTRALIVGISKYEYVDTLQYADIDAKMFAEYLHQNSFWGIQKEDITLLTNDKARYGDLTVQLQRIAISSKPGDNLLFYFSGHGDVETQTIFNRGYLLAYDTYSSNYMANGLRVDDLKDLFVTLLSNNVKVIIVTDACRSGKLAGGLKGAEFTATAISNMWKNEIKILSSQPGQLSYEDKKWGNGRGVFSYYLINGLNGDADANKDSSITLSELEMYVGSNVARETGNKQQPIFEGPNKFSTIIGKISGNTIKDKGKAAGNSANRFLKLTNLSVDSCILYYEQMNKAINEKKLTSDNPNSATAIYKKLKSCAKGDDLQFRANSDLLSSLINASQEIINNSFVGNKIATKEDFNKGIDFLEQIIDNNDIRLPNVKHIINLKRYLHVQGKATWGSFIDLSKLGLIIDSAINEEPDAAYLLTAKGSVEMKKRNWDNAIAFLERSVEKSPGWLTPKYQLGVCYGNKKRYQVALNYFEEVLKKDTTYSTFECTKCILSKMADYAQKTNQERKRIDYLLKSIHLFPDYEPAYYELNRYTSGRENRLITKQLIDRVIKYSDPEHYKFARMRFDNAVIGNSLSIQTLDSIKMFLKDNIDSAEYYYTLSLYYQNKKTYDSDSIYYCLSTAIQLDTTDADYLLDLSVFHNEQQEYNETIHLLSSRIKYFTGDEKAQLQLELANSYLYTENYKESFDLIKELREGGYYTCADLEKMKKAFRSLPEFDKYQKACKDK